MQNLSSERKSAYSGERVRNYYFKYDDARAESPLISDGGWVDAWPDNPHVAESHGRGINILFKGAHVQRISLEKVCRYKWHRYFTTVAELGLP
jgi:hypothetical protein